jgi:hypothetical protein
MGVAGYSTTEPSVIGDLILLPRGCQWNSNPNGVLEENIRNVTTGGRRFDNIRFDRFILEFNFNFPQSENAQFRALYYACRAADIWYVPDSDDMATKFHVRLHEPGYDPKNDGQPGQLTSTMEMWFIWTFRISTETVEVEIED